MNPDNLPQPDADALAHSQALTAYIHAAIRDAGGRIPFGRYVELALYAPGLGYYSAGTAKFGPAGDFVTAPQISALFGQTIALGVADVLSEVGPDGVILEFGAGTGALACAVLDALAGLDALPREYWILEVSPQLKERQRAAIAELPAALVARVRWLDTLPEQPFSGVVLANEVLDALPFERFRVSAPDQFESAWVETSGEKFQLLYAAPPPELNAQLGELATQLRAAGVPLSVGYESEICPAARAFVFTIAQCLACGVVLLSDYGATAREYYLPERSRGTFLCHYRHRANEDPFWMPGLQDITAWVDFTAVAGAGVDAGLAVAGYTTQAHFLLGCGLDQVLGAQMSAQPERAMRLQSEAKTLTLPGEMGERFKFLGLSRDVSVPMRGFGFRDLAATL